KIIPKSIEKEVKLALSFYPELEDVNIEFRFKEDIKKSFMQAQPNFLHLLFKCKKKRTYYVFISPHLKIENKDFDILEVPKDVLTGWIGHELGHVMDYTNRSGFGLIWFGIRYLTSGRYIKGAERTADTYAVNAGMADYIVATKNFILNNANFSEKYKNRIKKWYLSPEEIMEIVEEIHEEKNEDDD
ncbi:MAG TPA: hypothetical protein VFM70_03930, partial [Salinimicrobium sp.]|nr:hypothetical protein [Salinimicrobium sp.]